MYNHKKKKKIKKINNSLIPVISKIKCQFILQNVLELDFILASEGQLCHKLPFPFFCEGVMVIHDAE